MSENGKNKREWVKTAAIIFLSIMLVLTFFAQSIMNYSLPEVATSYVQSGTITAKIRGTGEVKSGDPYQVKVTESRKVSGVAVTEGQTVQKGDVLFYLEDSESDQLKEARKALEAAQSEYDLALLTADISSSNIYSANENVSSEVYRQQITNAQAAVQKAEKAYNAAVDAAEAAKAAEKPYEQKVAQIEQTITDYTNQITHDNNPDVIKRSQDRVKNTEAAYKAAKAAYENAKADPVSGGDPSQVPIKEKEMNDKYNEYQAAVKSENERAAAVNNLSAGKADWELQREIVAKDLAAAQAATKEKEDAVTAAQTERDEKQADLDKLVGNIGNVVKLEQMLDAIADAQKLVDELSAKSYDAVITADISGTVTQLNVKAGETTSAAEPVAVLQPEGAGYTLSFSVTNDQAKRLSVGDRADLVNAWRYDDVELTLASIKPDKTDPSQKKELVFNVTGDVVAGQTFSVSVGQKSANYDLTVPNNAIREDSNGKFILIMESKSTPLGTRYTATRVDVEVLASDDTQSAITGGLNGYEYVITTANKPVEPGSLVRPADD
ncbi:MAG: biotin/lipoyl-binding protein [Firmicutes bacterium]|nr:biotin/lipoyl-binding protein [Bacillota bacterium]